MKRKFLEDLGLEKDLIDKVLDENSADIGKAKAEVEGLKDENIKVKANLTDRDKQLDDLKKVDAESLQAEIERLQADNKAKDEAHATEMRKIKVDAAVEKALAAAGAKNTKAARALLDLENAELDGDEVKGLAKQIKNLVSGEDTKFMFESAEPVNTYKPASGKSTSVVGNVTIDDFRKMGYQQRNELFQTDKQTYDTLISQE